MTPKTKADEKLLLVDDDIFLLDMYAMKFKQCGADVDAMSDPVAALEKLRSGYAPSIILVDIIMPQMSGFVFLEAVQKEGLAPGAKIIILSNQGEKEDTDKATALGAIGYIIKASAIPSEVCERAFALARKK